MPAAGVLIGGLLLITVWRVWFENVGRNLTAIKLLPPWPLSADKAAGPGSLVGEVHHPVKAVEIRNPKWLTIPERGLYTGVAIFGAVGSGKTSACMRPFAEQILSWQAGDPQRRAAGLVLKVKGDFCHDIRRILADAGRIVLSSGLRVRRCPLDQELRPSLHQRAPALKQVRAGIGRFHLVPNHVRQRRLHDRMGRIRAFCRPIAKA